jgi:hypothetical protein
MQEAIFKRIRPFPRRDKEPPINGARAIGWFEINMGGQFALRLRNRFAMRRPLRSRIRTLMLRCGVERIGRYPFLRKVNAYRPPTAPARHLSPAHLAPIQLSVRSDDEKPHGTLHAIWQHVPGGHKWHHYFETYEEVFAQLGNRPIRLLEIGVYRGGSSRMWRSYLPPESIIVGLDIDPECKAFEEPERNLFIRIGDQSDPRFLAEVIREFGQFDLIIDDGSHLCSHMIASFNHLFLTGLKNPGIYLAEDTHANFWHTHRDQRYSFVDLAKDLVDVMHSHYVGNESERKFRLNEPARMSEIVVPKIAAEIDEIRFRDSLVVIRRKTRAAPPVSEHL